MDVEADWIVDRNVEVDELEGDGAFDLFSLFRAVVDEGLVKDEVVLFPVEEVAAPHVKHALHCFGLYNTALVYNLKMIPFL